MKVNIGPYPKSDQETQEISIQIDDYDTWSAAYFMCLIMHPLLIRFKEKNNSYPMDLTMEKWDEILDKMIFSCQMMIDDDIYVETDGKPDFEKTRKLNNRINEGFKLMGKYFRDLWW